MLAEIWTGCKCPNAETWNVGTYTEFDNDKDYKIPYCTICMSTNIIPKKNENGLQCMHGLTDDEIFWENENDEER